MFHPVAGFLITESIICTEGIYDATGQEVSLYLAESECLEGYFQTMYFMMKLFGISIITYPGKYTIFFSSKKDKLSLEEEFDGKRINLIKFG